MKLLQPCNSACYQRLRARGGQGSANNGNTMDFGKDYCLMPEKRKYDVIFITFCCAVEIATFLILCSDRDDTKKGR